MDNKILNLGFRANSNKFMLYVFIVFSSVLFSFFVLSNTTLTIAHAGGIGIGGGDSGGGGGGNLPGGGVITPPSGGGGDGGSDTPREIPFDVIAERGSSNFSVGCTNWNGSGSYQPNSNCNISSGAVMGANPNPYKEQWDKYSTGVLLRTPGLRGNETCGPNGFPSAYKQNWWAEYSKNRTFIKKVYADGRVEVGPGESTRITVRYAFNGCSYPTPQYEYQRCYWNNSGNIRFNMDRTTPVGNWSMFYVRPAQAGDPGEPWGGNGGTPPQGKCTGGTAINHWVDVYSDVDKYGYYSAVYSFNSRLYTRTLYVAEGRVYWDAGWRQGGNEYHTNRNYFTFSCQPNGGNPIQGPYWNQGSIPNVDGYLNPAACPQVSWQCKLGTPTTIGLERNAVLSGVTPAGTTSTVMRNGQKINVDFANVRVVDTSTPNDIDITDGGQAPGVRNISNIEYQTNVKNGSTPFFGTDPNSAQQYFKYYVSRSSDQKERFGQWISNNNRNQEKSISFNWASESSAQAFQLQRNYRVSGEFFTPGGSGLGSGGAGGNPGYEWKFGRYDCMEKSGRGSGAVNIGPLVSTSNPVDVLRSTNK